MRRTGRSPYGGNAADAGRRPVRKPAAAPVRSCQARFPTGPLRQQLSRSSPTGTGKPWNSGRHAEMRLKHGHCLIPRSGPLARWTARIRPARLTRLCICRAPASLPDEAPESRRRLLPNRPTESTLRDCLPLHAVPPTPPQRRCQDRHERNSANGPIYRNRTALTPCSNPKAAPRPSCSRTTAGISSA